MRVETLPLACGPALTAKLAASVPTVEAALLHGPGLPLPDVPPDDASAAEGALLASLAAAAAPRAATGAALAAAAAHKRPTGLPPLDPLLGGGLRPGVITEVFGGPAAGKTGVCLAAAARAAGDGGTVLWLASGAAFPAARLAAVLSRQLPEGDRDGVAAALERVTVVPVADGRAAAAALDAAAAAASPPASFSLIVLDSAAAALGVELGPTDAGRGVAAGLARALKTAAAAAAAPVLVTVHEVGGGGGGWDGGPAARPPAPSLGEGWRPHAAVRVRVAPSAAGDARRRVVTVTKGAGTGGAAEVEVG